MSSLLVCAGEPSSDAHAAGVIERILAQRPSLEVFGVGGPALKAIVSGPLLDNAPLAHTGLTEVLLQIPDAIRLLRGIKRLASERRPSVALLVDTPDFNMRLLAPLKRLGIPLVYFIAPQAWAWRKGRAKKLSRTIDRLFVIFPFEEAFFRDFGVRASYVGHPAPLRLESVLGGEPSLSGYEMRLEDPVVAILPGSRYNELRRHWPLFAEAFEILRRRVPTLKGVVALAPGIPKFRLEEIRSLPEGVFVSEAGALDVLKSSSLALMSSGSVTLEAGLMGRPGVIVYRMSGLTYRIAKTLVSVEHIGMVNLLLGERVLPELIQNEANPERIARELESFLVNPELFRRTKEKLLRLKGILGSKDAYGAVAKQLLEVYL